MTLALFELWPFVLWNLDQPPLLPVCLTKEVCGKLSCYFHSRGLNPKKTQQCGTKQYWYVYGSHVKSLIHCSRHTKHARDLLCARENIHFDGPGFSAEGGTLNFCVFSNPLQGRKKGTSLVGMHVHTASSRVEESSWDTRTDGRTGGREPRLINSRSTPAKDTTANTPCTRNPQR